MSEVGSRFQRTYQRPIGSAGRFVRAAFWWERVLKIQGWTSEFGSVNATLGYLRERKVGSEGSRRSYGYYFALFCQQEGVMSPDEFLTRRPTDVAKSITEFVQKPTSWSSHYRNTVTSYLMMHFRINGFEGKNALAAKTYRVPRRFRVNAEHIPTSAEIWSMANVGDPYGRALILFLYATGLRVSTLCAIKYRDIVSELESRVEPMFIPVFPEMKLRVAGACKGNVPYYTFVKGLELDNLRVHSDIVKEYLGELFTENTFLFPPMAPSTPKSETATLPLSRQAVFHTVKHLAKKAGMSQWFDVYPHCIRKAYQRVLRSPRPDGSLIDAKTQEFLMGHVLQGQQDNYFGSGVYFSGSTKYSSHLVDELRQEYEGLSFEPMGYSKSGFRDSAKRIESPYATRMDQLEEENRKLRAEVERYRRD